MSIQNRSLSLSAFLRRAFLADAMGSTAVGMLLALDHGALAPMLGLSAPFLLGVGLITLPFAMAVGWMSSRQRLPRWAIWAVVLSNALWALQSAVLLIGGWVHPTGPGQAFVIGQAIWAAVFADLEWFGMARRSSEQSYLATA